MKAIFVLLVLLPLAFSASITLVWAVGINQGPQNINVGDSVLFQFSGSAHTVNQFTGNSTWATCDFTGSTSLSTSGPYTWNATTTGDFYFGCSIPTHCAGNMNVHVIVGTVPTTTTSTSATSTSSTSSSSSSNDAGSVFFAFGLLLISLLFN